MKGAYMCARFGYSSSTQALVKSPIINLEGGGEAVLTFKGAPYGDDGTKLNITVVGVDGGEATLGQNDFQMTYNQWTNFKTTLKGKGKVRLVIQGERRYFLDEVLVVKGTTGISGVTADKPNLKGRIYTTSGVYVGTDFDVLPQGVYVVNGKKVVK
jgi:immune inhibitor A